MSDLVARPRVACDQAYGVPGMSASLLNEAADRIEYLESVAGAVSQAPEPLPFAKRVAPIDETVTYSEIDAALKRRGMRDG